MASIHTVTSQTFHPLSKPKLSFKPNSLTSLKFPRTKQKHLLQLVRSISDELPTQSADSEDHQNGAVSIGIQREIEVEEAANLQVVGGFCNDGLLSFEAAGFSSPSISKGDEQDFVRLMDRTINATIVLAAGSFAITKLLTIDQDYWHGWTLFEIVKYAPKHNWIAYEEALKTNPVLAKMMISGVVYSLGDWIAQCVEGKPLFEFDRTRMFRSGLVGFTLHGSLSHYYYQFCEVLFPFHDWWVVPVKVVFDQTVWSGIWNSIYYVFLGILRLESPISIFNELKATFFPMLTAGWKLWPFAHLITYGVVPVEQRLLWVDCVELIWVTILSTYSNEKSEARILDAPADANSTPPEE
jgi:protein Mpv17